MSGGASFSVILLFSLLCWGSDCVQLQAGFGLAGLLPGFGSSSWFGLAGILLLLPLPTPSLPPQSDTAPPESEDITHMIYDAEEDTKAC